MVSSSISSCVKRGADAASLLSFPDMAGGGLVKSSLEEEEDIFHFQFLFFFFFSFLSGGFDKPSNVQILILTGGQDGPGVPFLLMRSTCAAR